MNNIEPQRLVKKSGESFVYTGVDDKPDAVTRGYGPEIIYLSDTNIVYVDYCEPIEEGSDCFLAADGKVQPSGKVPFGKVESLYDTGEVGVVLYKKTTQAKAQPRKEKAKTQVQQKKVTGFAAFKAAFPDDLDFAIETYKEGTSLEDAKAEYCEIQQGRQDHTEQSTEGAPALVVNDSPMSDGKPTDTPFITASKPTDTPFITAARELAADEGISMTAALKKVARQQSE